MGRSWKNRLGSRVKLSSGVRAILKIFCALVILLPVNVNAGRFVPGANCVDGPKTCVDSGEKVIDGFKVTKDCWQWVYTKTCNYPSKNNCGDYAHCYAIADLPCLLHDAFGNCVNMQKEFCCKSSEVVTIDKEVARSGFTEKEGPESLVCSGIPCIDGNCVDKSYQTNGEMMDSIAKLYTVSQMKDGSDINFKLFAGNAENCTKKITDYTNCCSTSVKGWGRILGAGCSSGEKDLMEKRRKNLCVYVGKKSNKTLGITTSVKHHFCCFSNMLNKVIQVEGRKQLGMSFGSGGSPDCRGLTLEELQKVDFEKMDLTEFIEEFKVKFWSKYKGPNIGDLTTRIKDSAANIKQGDDNPTNRENKKAGFTNKMGN